MAGRFKHSEVRQKILIPSEQTSSDHEKLKKFWKKIHVMLILQMYKAMIKIIIGSVE